MIKTEVVRTCYSALNLLNTQDVKSDVDSMIVGSQVKEVSMKSDDDESLGSR